MDLDNVIKKRRSVRKFSSKRPNWRDIIECVDMMRYSPTAGKNFALRLLITESKEKIEKISEAAQQPFISQAHYALVVYSDPAKIKNSFPEKADKYLRQQAGAAIQNFLLKIEEKGLSTCWIGHLVDSQVKKIFSIPDNMELEGVFPIGYEFKKENPSNKIDFDRVLFFEKHNIKKMRVPKKFDV